MEQISQSGSKQKTGRVTDCPQEIQTFDILLQALEK
jgi:hypothetical protein